MFIFVENFKGGLILPSKYQFYAALAERQARQVTQSMGDWTGFLSTAGRLYKYPFEEQLMIHAQRPDCHRAKRRTTALPANGTTQFIRPAIRARAD